MGKSEQITNPLGYDRELFIRHVDEAMHLSKLDYDTLATKFTELGYSITSSNLRTYITQRNLSLKVLIFLSKTLNVSMDYLIGNEVGPYGNLNHNFDHELYGSRYMQYPGTYFVYFYATRTNTPDEIIKATLEIRKENGFLSTLKIPVPNNAPKIYTGHLILSKKTDTAFLSMAGLHGEIVSVTFNDPNTNQNKFRFCIAAMLSVSSGDSKRMPTMNRAIITECAVSELGLEFLAANLRLNSKYIHIQTSELQRTLKQFLQEEGVENEDTDKICMRLENAFKAKHILSIEEAYFLNTFKNENELTNFQAERLIALLRKHSMSDINVKTPRSIDARLFLLMKEEGMFITLPENK